MKIEDCTYDKQKKYELMGRSFKFYTEEELFDFCTYLLHLWYLDIIDSHDIMLICTKCDIALKSWSYNSIQGKYYNVPFNMKVNMKAVKNYKLGTLRSTL